MKANELRIGNLVNYCDKDNVKEYFTVEMIGTEGVYLLENEYFVGFSHIEPIPLTEDWLLKLGFDKNPDMSYYSRNSKVHSWWLIKDGLIIQMYLNYDNMIDFRFNYPSNDSSSFKFVDIESVHQLQNLYFALTGEELTIKL